MWRIYFSSAAGLDYTGVQCKTKEEAEKLCKKYDEGSDTTYGCHIARKA